MEKAARSVRSKVVKSFCTTTEAAERLGVSIRTIQLWSENGMLQAWKTEGGHRRIPLESLEKLLANRSHIQQTRKPATTSERFRILVVEDNPLLLMLYKLQCERWSISPKPKVEIAEDGFQALVKIGENPPHLLITDLMMPHINGFEMVRRLRALPDLGHMAIVAVSGLGPAAIEAAGGPPAGIPILPKPVPFKELEAIAVDLAARLRLDEPPERRWDTVEVRCTR